MEHLSNQQIQAQIQSVAKEFEYQPNTQHTLNCLKESIRQQFKSLYPNSLDDFDVSCQFEEPPEVIDKIADECQSYSQYQLKKAIISGESASLTEEQFDKQKTYSQGAIHLDIKFKPSMVYVNQTFATDNLSS